MTRYLLAVLLAMQSAITCGASVVDQSWLPLDGGWASLYGRGAQVFTLGTTGVLDRIDAPLRPNYITVEPNRRAIAELSLLKVVNGIPGHLPADVLASATFDLPVDGTPVYSDEPYLADFRWLSLTGLGLAVNAGDQFAVAVGTPDPDDVSQGRWEWIVSAGPPEAGYDGGALWMQRPTDPTFLPPPSIFNMGDAAFRVFVTPVPEPTAVGLIGASLFGLVALRRR